MKTTTGAAAPIVTTSYPFFSCGSEEQLLFSVTPGIPIIDALETAGYLLEEIEEILKAMTDEETPCWGRLYFIACKSIIDSVVQTLLEGGKA
jgi:hypothetical protein